MIKDRRIGKFMVSFDAIHRNSDEVSVILSLLSFVPLKVETHSWSANYEYVGISPLFELIDEGALPHLYKVEYDSSSKEIKVIKSE